MRKIVVCGHEFPFNAMNIDVMDTLVAADEEIQAAITPESIDKLVKAATSRTDTTPLKVIYALVDQFFVKALGEGALAKILDDEYDPLAAIDAYYEMSAAVSMQFKERAQETSEKIKNGKRLAAKYNPDNLKR